MKNSKAMLSGSRQDSPDPVAGIDDSTVVDAEFGQPDLPHLELVPASIGERQMVQTNSTLIKRTGVRWIGNS